MTLRGINYRMNVKYGRKRLWPISKHCADIYLKELSKIMEILVGIVSIFIGTCSRNDSHYNVTCVFIRIRGKMFN
jgi:hypothetical protein